MQVALEAIRPRARLLGCHMLLSPSKRLMLDSVRWMSEARCRPPARLCRIWTLDLKLEFRGLYSLTEGQYGRTDDFALRYGRTEGQYSCTEDFTLRYGRIEGQYGRTEGQYDRTEDFTLWYGCTKNFTLRYGRTEV
ncbi:hypothetical protein Fmac_032984 [Flemingia macrophylla]|uniref:Uncharacterized protein n=1 Tax=Flemingia macrophylla TaxID=520843 RepID=A0ABD1L6H0_9FABA